MCTVSVKIRTFDSFFCHAYALSRSMRKKGSDTEFPYVFSFCRLFAAELRHPGYYSLHTFLS